MHQARYDSVILLKIAHASVLEAREDREKRPIGSLQKEALTAVLMAVAAAEGFCNEILERIRLWDRRCFPKDASADDNDDHFPEETTDLREVVEQLRQRNIEALRSSPGWPRLLSLAKALKAASGGPLIEKYREASRVLAGGAFDAAVQPLQDFKLLVALRNSIMHMRPVDVEGRHLAKKIVEQLIERGIVEDEFRHVDLHWLDHLMNRQAAAWAYTTSLNMIRALIDILPTDIDESNDPFSTAKWVYRDPKQFPDP